jgi:CheY-like chemotaxis protein
LEIGYIPEASNGREALATVRRHCFDLILTDIDMPIMDGLQPFEALTYLRGAENTPVVAITKPTSKAVLLRSMDARARAYLF